MRVDDTECAQPPAMRGVRSSTYILRFDDICPTMNWRTWDRIEEVLLASGATPILAIVPDNKDEKLVVEAANARFWDRARQWRDYGWTIALHGYQHRYVSQSAGIVGMRKKSEFAGVDKHVQAEKLQKATALMADQGLEPTVWVAPGHTFDETTVSLLPGVGIHVISDGHSRFPFRRGDITWVPQQLWEFREAPAGVWTICFHHNDWSCSDFERFCKDLDAFRSRLTDVRTALARPHSRFDPSRLLLTRPKYADILIRAQLKLHEFTTWA